MKNKAVIGVVAMVSLVSLKSFASVPPPPPQTTNTTTNVTAQLTIATIQPQVYLSDNEWHDQFTPIVSTNQHWGHFTFHVVIYEEDIDSYVWIATDDLRKTRDGYYMWDDDWYSQTNQWLGVASMGSSLVGGTNVPWRVNIRTYTVPVPD